jgi:hypothetical protein
MKGRRDPMDTVIESALQPGRFIDGSKGIPSFRAFTRQNTRLKPW